MSLLRNYSISSNREFRLLIGILSIVAIAFVTSWLLLNSTIYLLVIIFLTVLLFLYLNNNLSYFYLVLYGIMVCIPWGRNGQMKGQIGWGAPSGAIFNIQIEYTYIVILLFLYLIALKEIVKERDRLLNIPNFQYFIIFIMVGIISSVLGLNPSEGLLYVLKTLAVPMLGGFLMAYWITSSEKAFKTLTLGIIFLTSIISLYAVYEFITNSNPIEMFVLEHFPVGKGETIEKYQLIKSYTYQSNATFGNPILAAFVLMVGFLLSVGYYIYYSLILKSKKSFLFFLLIMINFSGIFVTFSRGVLFSAIIALLIYIRPYIKKIGRIVLIVFSITLVSSLILQTGLSFYLHQDIFQRFNLEYILASDSFAHRYNAYYATIYILKYHPFFGTGYANIMDVYNSISIPVTLFASTMDNTFLEILSLSGVIGFLSFMILLLKYWKNIHDKLKELTNLKFYPILRAIYISIIAMLIASLEFWLFGQLTSSLTFWTFVGMLASITLTDVKYKFEKNESK